MISYKISKFQNKLIYLNLTHPLFVNISTINYSSLDEKQPQLNITFSIKVSGLKACYANVQCLQTDQLKCRLR